ncbi:hypothetical protein F4780DRAFT_792686 [Xylariomycetidae sp. FL0641]|nr:hypothetical protein F4780DRAFT_792686 [Xylariomycetidae sp. FL0641]
MSSLFSRSTTTNPNRGRPPLTEALCNTYLEQAEAFEAKIPKELSFDEIIKNNTTPPCSLNDFMDYLVHVEHNAEGLQFFLWYCDYVRRWARLPPARRARCPVWNAARTKAIQSSHSPTSCLGERTEKFGRVLTLLDQQPQAKESRVVVLLKHQHQQPGLERSDSARNNNFSYPIAPSPVVDPEDEFRNKWEPFSVQPNRDEVIQIAQHYLSAWGPRALPLDEADRTACLHAVQHTTHPSAFLPALAAVDASLRGRSHPAFAGRWALRSSNAPRTAGQRALGALLLAAALALSVLLVRDGTVHPAARLAAAPLGFAGLLALATARHGLCLRATAGGWTGYREVRPWEPRGGDDDVERGGSAAARDGERKSVDSFSSTSTGGSGSGSDPLRKPSLQPLGPANDSLAQEGKEKGKRRGFWRAVMGEETVKVPNRQVAKAQQDLVVRAVIWAGCAALAVTTVVVVVPSPGGR